MSGDRLRTLAVVVGLVAVAMFVRANFVRLLTRTTGTWIGAPDRA